MRTHFLAVGFLAVTVAIASACGGNVTIGTGGSTSTGTGTGTGAGGSTGGGTTGTTTTTNPPPEDFTSCNGPGQCILANNGCCSPCGNVTLSDFQAINKSKSDAFFKYVCPSPVPCPGCATFPNANFFAYCSAGKCVAADVRTDPVSQCKTDSDCHLRGGTGCCEMCGQVPDQEVVAVSAAAPQTIEALECTPMSSCPDCIATYPAGSQANCGPGGHCVFVVGK